MSLLRILIKLVHCKDANGQGTLVELFNLRLTAFEELSARSLSEIENIVWTYMREDSQAGDAFPGLILIF